MKIFNAYPNSDFSTNDLKYIPTSTLHLQLISHSSFHRVVVVFLVREVVSVLLAQLVLAVLMATLVLLALL